MNEYASRFFLLLKHAVVIHAHDQLELLEIMATPYVKGQFKKTFDKYHRIIQNKEPVDYARIKEDREKLMGMVGFIDKRPKSP